jgi:hypothetical protein
MDYEQEFLLKFKSIENLRKNGGNEYTAGLYDNGRNDSSLNLY